MNGLQGGGLSVFDALRLLTPFDVDRAKIRLGPATDGGYVFVDDLRPEQTVLSYGIATEFRLEQILADAGHQVYMFDHTINPPELGSHRMRFFQEGVSHEMDGTGKLFSVADHLQRHNIDGDSLILKMDVEGAEFTALGVLSDEVLGRFEQIVLEVHSLDLLCEVEYRLRFGHLFKKLNRHFTLFHVHANNFDGPDGLAVCEGLVVPKIIELSYVRSASVRRRPSQTLYPTPLDFPNTPQRDKLLWFFPFLPTTIGAELFEFCAARAASFGQ